MIRELYDKKAGVYDSLMNIERYDTAVKAIIGSIAGSVDSSARVLDLGCGTGLAMEPLVERLPESQLVGVDCSEEMLKICRERFPEARLLLGDFNEGTECRTYPDGEEVPLEPESFDLIVSTGAVSEYGVLEKVVPEIFHLTAPGGIFVNIGIRKMNPINHISGKVWQFKPTSCRTFVQACRDAGFSRVRRSKIPWKHFPVNTLKYVVESTK